MKINVRTTISEAFDNIEIKINAPERNEQVSKIEQYITSVTEDKINEIIGMKNNDIFIIDINDVIEFFTDERNIFCRTSEGNFIVKEKLYWLEDNLPINSFVRISNSVIININHVKCFNTSIIGKILVKFKDGSEETVAKRKTSEIMKFLKERRG